MAIFQEPAASGPRDGAALRTETLYVDQVMDLSGERVEEREVELNELGLNRAISNVKSPRLTIYMPEAAVATGVGMLVIPGGGFTHLAIDKEGYDIARWLNGLGVAAFVLTYRTVLSAEVPQLPPMPEGLGQEEAAAWQKRRSEAMWEARHRFIPLAVADSRRALRTMRARAEAFGVNPAKIGVIGFSAGGYLTVELGLSWDEGDAQAADPIERASSRPDFMVPMYPANPPNTAERINAQTPPAFIVQAWDDFLPVQNSLTLASGLAAAGVPAEAHLYAQGGHGFGLGVKGGPVASWTARFADWLGVMVG